MADPFDLDHLEELAQKATPGPWGRWEDIVCVTGEDDICRSIGANWDNDGPFIEATGPDVVLELIARLRHAVDAADAARSALDVQAGLLDEARANDRQAMAYLEQVRGALGHNGDFPSMVGRVRELVREASDPQMDALMALLAEARPHVVGSPDSVRGGLIEEIDAALAKRAEESQ